MTPTLRRIASLIHPLDGFYAASGRTLPRMEAVSPADIPQPYRTLLVHEQDMTSTLEAWWGQSLRLRVLKVQSERSRLNRQVVLITERDESPIEFGAIEIQLGLFPTQARDEIVACDHPLGAILRRYNVPYVCRPNAFFRIERDSWTRSALQLEPGPMLFGRHNLLLDPGGGTLAEVVEILPPMNPTPLPVGLSTPDNE